MDITKFNEFINSNILIFKETYKSMILETAHLSSTDSIRENKNYKEIVLFKQLCAELGIQQINFQKMWNWYTWSEDEFVKLNVYNPAHPEYKQVINLLQQTHGPGPKVYF